MRRGIVMSLEGLKRTRRAYKYADEAWGELSCGTRRALGQPADWQRSAGLVGRKKEEYRGCL